VSLQATQCTKLSGYKFPEELAEFGLNRRLNRRFRKQSGGLLIRGSEKTYLFARELLDADKHAHHERSRNIVMGRQLVSGGDVS